MVGFLTFLITLGVGYASIMEGFFTAFMMFINVVLSSIITCSFWEPLAGQLESMFAGSFLAGYEDVLSMVLIFAFSLGLLRTLTNNLVNTEIEFDETLQRVGGGLFGILSGYLTAGFLTCALQTMPWHDNFMGFDARYDPNQSAIRSYLPSDRVWLALMHYGSDNAFSNSDHHGFDENASFELRYSRYRRFTEQRPATRYGGEFDADLNIGGRGALGR